MDCPGRAGGLEVVYRLGDIREAGRAPKRRCWCPPYKLRPLIIGPRTRTSASEPAEVAQAVTTPLCGRRSKVRKPLPVPRLWQPQSQQDHRPPRDRVASRYVRLDQGNKAGTRPNSLPLALPHTSKRSAVLHVTRHTAGSAAIAGRPGLTRNMLVALQNQLLAAAHALVRNRG
jgi:hypothetical protein